MAGKTKSVNGVDHPSGDFLVVGDPEDTGTWHLPVKKNGTPDHGLMGAAKAALTSNYWGKSYEGPDKQKAIDKLKALYKAEKMEFSIASDFLFVELSAVAGLVDGKPFDALAAGTFQDMHGVLVTFAPEDLVAIVENTQAAIQSSKTESGELVGLPIDATNHDHVGGAGWIVGATLIGDKVQFIPKWTEIGASLINKKERRFFSASVDMENEVVLGGTLCNWPALRDSGGRFKVRPIEMSSALFEAEEEPDKSQQFWDKQSQILEALMDLKEFLTKLAAGATPEPKSTEGDKPMPDDKKVTPPVPADLTAVLAAADPAKLNELLEARVQSRVNELLAEQQRKAHIAEFAARIVGGTKETPFGLPVTQPEIVELLSVVTPEQQGKIEALLSKVVKDGFLHFGESGHDRRLVSTGTKKLDEKTVAQFKKLKAANKDYSIEEFMQVNANVLGPIDQYNLAEFATAKEK